MLFFFCFGLAPSSNLFLLVNDNNAHAECLYVNFDVSASRCLAVNRCLGALDAFLCMSNVDGAARRSELSVCVSVRKKCIRKL